MNKTTLQDIAEYTGLSISTVSRILRGESKADSKNVELTINAAMKLDYPLQIPYLNAKYKFKSDFKVALITTFAKGAFYSSFFAGLNEASKENKFDISLHDLRPNEVNIVRYINGLISQNIDASILFLPTLKEVEYRKLLTDLPSSFTVISVLPALHPILDTITFDSYGGGYLMAQHFHKKGYHEVGIINGPFERNESLLRRNGFQDYITQHPEMKLVWSFDGHFEFEDGMSAFDHFCNSNERPRAIFSANDVMAIGFMKMANKAGLSIPEDIAIGGYDDLDICSYIHPTLTSINTDYKILGVNAFKVLKNKISGEENHTGIQSLIPVNLSVREST